MYEYNDFPVRFTKRFLILNKLRVALTVCEQDNSKVFRYNMIYEEKSFETYFKDITLLQT